MDRRPSGQGGLRGGTHPGNKSPLQVRALDVWCGCWCKCKSRCSLLIVQQQQQQHHSSSVMPCSCQCPLGGMPKHNSVRCGACSSVGM